MTLLESHWQALLQRSNVVQLEVGTTGVIRESACVTEEDGFTCKFELEFRFGDFDVRSRQEETKINVRWSRLGSTSGLESSSENDDGIRCLANFPI